MSIAHCIITIPLSACKYEIINIDFHDPYISHLILSMAYGVQRQESLQTKYSESLFETLCPGLGKDTCEIIRIRLEGEQIKHEIIPLPMNAGQIKHEIIPMPLVEYNPPQIAHSILPIRLMTRSVIMASIDFEIKLDGAVITHYVQSAKITLNESNPHNTVELSCMSSVLYFDAKEMVELSEKKQIEFITDGNQSEFFLLELIDGNARSFQLWGRSLSALYSEEESGNIDYTVEQTDTASNVAKIEIPALDWQATDWPFFNYSFSGSPISIAKRLAEACGAVVRCSLDGSVYVRSIYPTAPIDMPAAAFVCRFDESNIFSLSKTNQEGSGFDAIDVQGPATDSNVNEPDIVIETGAVKGGDAFVKVYFPTSVIPELSTTVSAGDIEYLGLITEVITEEQITFRDGYATSQYPIVSGASFSWIGYNSATIETTQYSKTVYCSSKEYGVGLLSYTTKYAYFRCFNHDVNVILGQLSFETDTTDIQVALGEGENLNPSAISDELLQTESVAIARGKAELRQNYYDRTNISLTAPLDSDNKSMIDGDLVFINSPQYDIQAVCKVKGVTREYTTKQLITVEAELCQL